MENFFSSINFIGTNLNVPESEIIIMLFLPAALTFLLFKIYLILLPRSSKIFNDLKGVFFISIILSSSVAIVMMLVSDNLARAFALLGLFSIIRFRNSGKSMIPLLFIIVSIVIGIITGLTFFPLAIQFALFVGIVILLNHFLERTFPENNEEEPSEKNIEKSKEKKLTSD